MKLMLLQMVETAAIVAAVKDLFIFLKFFKYSFCSY